MKLHELSVKRPIAVTMAILIFVVLGLYSVSMLPIDTMPEMDLKMAVVVTNYQNVGSEEIEGLVTIPLEEAIASVSGLDTMQSQSSEGMSIIMAQFTNDTDVDEAVSAIENNIDMISAMLPEDASEPMVLKLDMNALEAVMMSVSYEGYDLIQTKKFIEDTVEPKLKSAGGIASVNVSGGKDRIIEIEVEPEKLQAYNMSFSDIVTSIAAQNTNLPAGNTSAGNKDLSVRMIGEFSKVSDINLVPLMTSQGQIVYIKDVANVNDTYSDESTYSRINGENSITVSVSGESDANTVDVVNGVIDALEEIKAEHPKFNYNITMEQASYIEESISSVASSAIFGGLLAMIVLFLFLGNARNALVIGVSMPVSVITTFIGMFISGMTLNVVSLGGLALGVGMLVDNSVVVLENIFRRRKTYGDDAKQGAMMGTGEVIGAVIASVLTTCIVYVPILFIDNIMAVMFKQLAFSIVFSQTASLLTTMLIVPMLSSKIENIDEKNKKFGFILTPFEKMMNRLYDLYEKSLKKVLCKKGLFLGGVAGIFVLSLVVLGFKGMTLMPSSDEGIISISVELPQGTPLDKTDIKVAEIEEIVGKYKGVENISTSVGSGGAMSMLGATSSNQATITVTLGEKAKKTTKAVEDIRGMLGNVSGALISIEASNQTMSISSDEVSFQFASNDSQALYDYVVEAEKVLAEIDGVTETETSVSDVKSEVRIKLNSAHAARYGMNTTYASNLINNALNGATASKFTEKGTEYDIRVVYPEDYIKNYEELKNTRIKSPAGQWVTISDIAEVYVEQGQAVINRTDQKRVVTLSGKIYGTDIATVTKEFNNLLDKKVEKVEGVSQANTGAYEMMIDAMVSLVIAILLGILLMYMIMAAQFENLIHPLIILCTLPLAMIGVVLGLIVSGTPLSVISLIGVLMLVGIIVNNAIVLIEFINDQKKESPDMPREKQLVNAGLIRMRPILMTSLTSILGFLPMAFDASGGGVMMQPLAIALVGGLTVGTFLTLYVIPVVYDVVEGWIEKRKLKKA